MNDKNKKNSGSGSHANKMYYQSVYEQIHASENFKERLIHMNNYKENNRKHTKSNRRLTWKAAAAAIVLAAALPTAAYAANHYFGIADFFRQSGQPLSEDAGRLIETDIKQSPSKSGAETGNAEKTNEKLPVSFTVQEALCDSGTVSIVIEAKAAVSGRYLLVPDDCTTEEDSVENIGIHEDRSIGAYARAKGLEILYVSTSFGSDSPFSPSVCHYSSKSIQDDTLALFISADRSAYDTDLNTVLSHTVRPASSNKADAGILRTSSSFELRDKSQSRTVSYSPKDSGIIPGTQASVQKVTMEQTEVFTYADIFYQNPQGSEADDGLSFDVLGDDGNEWVLKEGRGIAQKEDGSYCVRLCFDAKELPERCVLNAYDCFEDEVYGQIVMVKSGE